MTLVITIPEFLRDGHQELQILVRTDDLEVDVREGGGGVWTPIRMLGGDFEERLS